LGHRRVAHKHIYYSFLIISFRFECVFLCNQCRIINIMLNIVVENVVGIVHFSHGYGND
jgi:hypothetical protein